MLKFNPGYLGQVVCGKDVTIFGLLCTFCPAYYPLTAEERKNWSSWIYPRCEYAYLKFLNLFWSTFVCAQELMQLSRQRSFGLVCVGCQRFYFRTSGCLSLSSTVLSVPNQTHKNRFYSRPPHLGSGFSRKEQCHCAVSIQLSMDPPPHNISAQFMQFWATVVSEKNSYIVFVHPKSQKERHTSSPPGPWSLHPVVGSKAQHN